MSEYFSKQFEKTGNPAFEQLYLNISKKPGDKRAYTYGCPNVHMAFGKANAVAPYVRSK